MRIRNVAMAAGVALFAVTWSSSGEAAEGSPVWSWACDGRTVDAFGDKVVGPACRLTVKNSGTFLGDAFVIGYGEVIRVDPNGVRLAPRLKISAACKDEPRRVAVDGNRIDSLAPGAQVDAVLKGRLLVWEEQGRWPHCGINARATKLAGLKKAYAEMMKAYAVARAER